MSFTETKVNELTDDLQEQLGAVCFYEYLKTLKYSYVKRMRYKMNRKRESYDRSSVGERIKEQRLKLNMSQEQLAEKIDRATKYCSDIECGACGMSIETMIAITKALETSMDYLIFGKECFSEKIRR